MRALGRAFLAIPLLLAPVVHAECPASVADVTGTYRLQLHGRGDGGAAWSTDAIGWFVADGSGNLNGVLTVVRQWMTHAPEAVEQAFTGSYSVSPDGRGVADLVITPQPVFFANTPRLPYIFSVQQVLRFTVIPGSGTIPCVLDAPFSCFDCPAVHHEASTGLAERVVTACEPPQVAARRGTTIRE